MAIKTFTKSAEYTQPPWTMGKEFVDGLYVDDFFFKNRIPIFGAYLTIRAKPTKHLRTRSLVITTPTYQAGAVGMRYLLIQDWLPLFDEEVTREINLVDFYGIGLNIFHIVAAMDVPTDVPVIYTIDYDLRVGY